MWGRDKGTWQEPEWERRGMVHDWRNYISDRVKEMWPDLPDYLKEALHAQADMIAGREEWD